MPHVLLVSVIAVVLLIVLKLAPRWFFSKLATNPEYVRKRKQEENTQELAEWMGQTGLSEDTERELPRYLRRELGEFLDDPHGLRAADLQYQGIHQDERGPAHFWRMPERGGEISFAYVDINSQGEPTGLGWGDRDLPVEKAVH